MTTTLLRRIVATVQAEKTGPGWMTMAMAAADASPVRGITVSGGKRRRGVRTGKKSNRTRERAPWYAGSATCRWAVATMGTNPIARPASTTKPALSTPKDFLGRKRKLARRKNGPSGTAVPQCREPLPGKQWCCASGGLGHDDEDTEGDPKRRPQDEVDPRIVVGPGRRPEKPCQFLPGPK